MGNYKLDKSIYHFLDEYLEDNVIEHRKIDDKCDLIRIYDEKKDLLFSCLLSQDRYALQMLGNLNLINTIKSFFNISQDESINSIIKWTKKISQKNKN